MDWESERGLRTGNRGPEIGNRKKDPESGTGSIVTGKGTGNRGKETGSGIGNRLRDWGTGPGNGTGKQDKKCIKSVCVNCCLFIRGSRRLPVPPESILCANRRSRGSGAVVFRDKVAN